MDVQVGCRAEALDQGDRTALTFVALAAQQAERAPVMAPMTVPGELDIVLASELIEAGRAVQRGLVTPGRPTLLTSTHRVYAIAEKTSIGDGRADSGALLALARGAADDPAGYVQRMTRLLTA